MSETVDFSSSTTPDLRAENPATLVPEGAPSLSRVSAHGMAWMSINSIIAKIIGMLSSIVLAHIVLKDDYGLVNTVYSLSAVGSVLTSVGLEEILVQRQKHFRRWATPAFWMGMACGILSALLLIAGAIVYQIVHSRISHDPATRQVFWLSAVLALNAPLYVMGIVPGALLRIQMRFRAITLLTLLTSLFQTIATLLLAWWGFKAYSFIVPRVMVTLLTTSLYWYLAFVPIGFRLHLRRWKFLIGTSAVLLGTRISAQYTSNGDNLMLALFWPQAIGGIYFQAFNYSTQAAQLFVMNMQTILFPALCKLQDDVVRQARAMLRTVQLMSSLAIPLCFLQAALAPSGIHLFLSPKGNPTEWYACIVPLQFLSIGAGFSCICWPAGALIPAQGRFRAHMNSMLVLMLVFFAMVAPGAWFGKATGTAIAVAIWYVIACVSLHSVALSPAKLGVGDLLKSVRAPLMAGAVGFGMGYLSVLLLPSHMRYSWAAMAQITTISFTIYLPLLHAFDPAGWKDLLEQAGQLLHRLRRK